MKTYLIADPHFDHERLMDITARPFPNVQEWNELIIENTNRMVGRSDRLIILGDFGFSNRIGYFRQQIKCRHVELIIGNHDQESKCRNVFGGSIWHQRSIKFFDTHLYLSHYAHCFWDGSHKGWMHVYGHNHNQREAYLDSIWPERRSMDVSPDTAFELFGEWRPFADHEVYERLSKREGHDKLEFYFEYQRQLAEKRQCLNE
jgi:calcineurin-like phosphoesterase family protein